MTKHLLISATLTLFSSCLLTACLAESGTEATGEWWSGENTGAPNVPPVSSAREMAEAKAKSEFDAALQSAQDEATAWLAQNATHDDVTTLASGLQYKVIETGSANGVSPSASARIKVHYEGRLINGKVFDSSYKRGRAEELNMDQLIPGWREAAGLMKAGDEWIIYIPPELAYGRQAMALQSRRTPPLFFASRSFDVI